MGRRQRKAARANTARQDYNSANQSVRLPRIAGADRRALLAGTALASTLLIAVMTAPTPAHAVVNCLVGNPAPGPITVNNPGDSISCVNTEARTNAGGNVIQLITSANGASISLDNSGNLTTGYDGIFALTSGIGANLTVTNSGDITVNSTTAGEAIFAQANGAGSTLRLNNSGDLFVTTVGSGSGIFAQSNNTGGPISITNSGDITVNAGDTARGIFAQANVPNSPFSLTNSGDITAVGGGTTYGIFAQVNASGNTLSLTNSGDISATSTTDRAFGIFAQANSPDAPLSLTNSGDITASGLANTYGFLGVTNATNAPISLTNTGDISVTSSDGHAFGIFTRTTGPDSSISLTNSGDITATSNSTAYGIHARSFPTNNTLSLTNSGDITATADEYAYGIQARTYGLGTTISVNNSAKINATSSSNEAEGIQAISFAPSSGINITNSGDVRASTTSNEYYATGIVAIARGADAPISINNSGSIYAEGKYSTGIYAYTNYNLQTTITNTGEIGASSHLAIDVYGNGSARIYNAGTITGYMKLTERGDLFVNQAGGTFEARKTTNFYGGSDVFRNQNGGTVHALRDGGIAPSITGLERFENRGTISTVDGATGDNFTISNTVGGTDLDFEASGNSRLAVDVSLGGPGSATDTFTVEGNVSGRTAVTVNNTNMVGGEFNPTGITIVTVTGATPSANGFSLDAPVDAGLFDYDLFFVPTGSGFWELRSFPGAGAHMLPQLVTAAQDMWHQGSSTWFDRTADLRVLLNGGGAAAYDQGGKSLGDAPQGDGIAPAVWVRGSGGWLDRDGSGSTSAYGRNYSFDLDRQLDTMDFQMGLDLGSRDLLSQGDALVFGMLGGFVHGDLDYDSIGRNFDFTGGQVGAYATYMKGGLFVDTLLNVHLMELDANGALGFPNNDLDATTVGLRSDAGYRFGSFSGGAFLEPLATLEVTWADIDGFALGGNSVKFDDDANVRGRLGLRAGTTMEAWEGTMMEPFVTGSLWGNLSGDNQATLVSNGSTFRYNDDIEDVWGELSAGLNFFNFSQTTSVFAKVDVTLGDDVTGLGGKAGMRVAW